MGLDAYCGSVSGKLGSYGWFHSFRLVVAQLEDGLWGSRFPLIQWHSDCDGEYSPAEAEELLQELYSVEKEFRDVDYPCALYLDAEGTELGYGAQYGEDGTFMFGNGWSMGVDDEGLVFYPRAGRQYGDPVHFQEISEGEKWFDLWFSKPQGTKRIAFSYKPAREVFAYTLELFIDLADESIRTQEPIVFC